MNKCLCQTFEFGEFDGENENAISYDTDCQRSTNRVFAQGHDAKLVGFAVRAEMAGEEIRMVEGGVAITFSGAVDAMGRVSEALAAKAQAQLDAAVKRVAKKELAEATKKARRSERKLARVEAKQEAPAPTPVWRSSKIKVGRWTYDAQIEIATGDATYATKLGGGTKMVEQGKYQEV